MAVVHICAYSHLLHAHFSAHGACKVTFAHLVAQVHEKGVCCMCDFDLSISLSLVSWLTHPCCFRTTTFSLDFPIHTFLPYLPVLKAQACASPHEDEKFGYLAISALNTGNDPRSSTRSLLWTVTRCSMTIQASMKSPTSRKTHTRPLDCSVFSQWFRTFLMMILLFK